MIKRATINLSKDCVLPCSRNVLRKFDKKG